MLPFKTVPVTSRWLRWNGRHARRLGLPRCSVARHDGFPVAPFPICFTRIALIALLRSVGKRPPESGAKGFGPLHRIGFDRVEFDENGSVAANGAVYSPDVVWGAERVDFHLNRPEKLTRVWTGDIHSHPGGFGSPSGRAGKGLGDLGYVEEVFDQNEAMEWFFIPILTGTASGEVVIHPWVCKRGRPVELMVARGVRVTLAAEFPPREFNPEWEQRVASSAAAREKSNAQGSVVVEIHQDTVTGGGSSGSGLVPARAADTQATGNPAIDIEELKRLITAGYVWAEPSDDGEVRVGVRRGNGSLSIELPRGFPVAAPRVNVVTANGAHRFGPLVWAASSSQRPEQRLAELCNLLAELYARPL